MPDPGHSAAAVGSNLPAETVAVDELIARHTSSYERGDGRRVCEYCDLLWPCDAVLIGREYLGTKAGYDKALELLHNNGER